MIEMIQAFDYLEMGIKRIDTYVDQESKED